ncbi:MAG: hypothetical protein ACFWUL_03750 [Dialister sp.]|jgi:hypothetical protein
MLYYTFQLRIKADQVAPPPNAPPCPLRGTSHTGKRVTGFSVAYGSLRIQFPCHPGGGSKSRLPLRGSWRRRRLRGCISKCIYLHSYLAQIHFFRGLSRGRGLLQRQLHVICAESLGFHLRRSREASTLNSQISNLNSFFFAAGDSAFLTASS